MITGELKNKIDGLWDIFAAGGLVNPLDVIEQITYIVSIFTALISGVVSYAITRKQSKSDIEKLCKQHEIDLESLRENHKNEIEKIELEHKHKIELMEKEYENQFSADLIKETMKIPSVQQQISSGFSNGMKKRHH